MTDIKVIRKEDDPIALRASIGGKEGVGYYCVFRGNPAEVVPMLEKVLDVMREPAINLLSAEREDIENFHERDERSDSKE